MYRSTEYGASIIETAICLPLLLVLLMGMVDVGRWIDQFYTVSRVTYESARYGASLAGMEEDLNHTRIWDENVNPAAFQGTASVAAQIKVRLSTMLELQNMNTSTAKLRLVFDRTPVNNSLNVEVTTPFKPIFPLLNGMLHQVKGQANAPYLFARTSEVPYQRSNP